jgi:DegV family protein with EDD domain
MNKVAILTDSTAYLPAEQISKYSISTIPLSVIWDNETFEDGVTIKPDEFYTRLKTAKTMPSTSQPSVGAMQQVFTSLLDQGYDVLGIFISSKLSGTVQSALQARDLIPGGVDRIQVLDSTTTIMSMGFPVLAAARAAQAGASLPECQSVAEQAREKSGVFFVVDTLEFLHRGGRIGSAQRFLGTALNMKPIMTVHDGKIEAIERVRTKGKALERLIELVAERCDGKPPFHLAASHSNSLQDAEATLKKVSAQFNPAESYICELSPVIGTHVGPGTIAISYLAGM